METGIVRRSDVDFEQQAFCVVHSPCKASLETGLKTDIWLHLVGLICYVSAELGRQVIFRFNPTATGSFQSPL